MTRYSAMFERLAQEKAGAFVPFVTLGDPTPELSAKVLRALIRGGADALELGIPFSDPAADGPTIQLASQRALQAGVTPDDCWDLIAGVRAESPDLPIGLLVYANLVVSPGLDSFYARAAEAGVDSVLIADVPTLEIAPFAAAAERHGVAPVLIAPTNLSDERLEVVASVGQGYTYVVTRKGVTGADDSVCFEHASLLAKLEQAGAPPPIFGFGISKPEHVRAALASGAAGTISGSAVVRHIQEATSDAALLEALEAFVASMKAATALS
ncbi:MAG: tryptophan synthase subunit alpha [Planctomycetes bacterium]|nr:tryptophan synthase subunit alpha [Planctomycetota bacterium]